MTTIGIDIGGRTHVVARCRAGQARADREILRVSQDRAGFAAFDTWLERQPEPVPEIASDRDFRHIEAKRKVSDGCQPTLLQLVRDELPPKRRKHGALSAGIGVDRY